MAVALPLLIWVVRVSSPDDVTVAKQTGYSREENSPGLFYRITTVTQLMTYADSLSGFAPRNSLAYGEILAKVIQARFYHGYATYTWKENWIAALAGRLMSPDFSAIVIPDDIMKHPMAACSQQAIILMECFRRAGTSYRGIYFDGHFALEGKYGQNWFYFDTDMEPDFSSGRSSFSRLVRSGRLNAVYHTNLNRGGLDRMLAHPRYGPENSFPAIHARIFHWISKVFSFVSLLGGAFFVFYKALMLDFSGMVNDLVRNENMTVHNPG